jgi:PAS domain S-box-containing protein
MSEFADASVMGKQCPDANGASYGAVRHVDAAWLLESVSDAMVVTDAQNRIVIVNCHTERMFGYSREELVGEPFEKLIPDRFRNSRVHCQLDESLAPQPWLANTESELCGLRKDDTEIPITVSLSSLKTHEQVLVSIAIRYLAQPPKRAKELQSRPEFEDMLSTSSKKLSQAEIEQQLLLEKTVAELSASFINLQPDKVDGQIREAQKRICESINLERSTLFQVSRNGDDPVVTHCWEADGFEQISALSAPELPWCTRIVLNGQRVSFERVDDLPEEAATDKDTIRRYGPKSSITFPLSLTGKVIGSLAFGSMGREREWPAAVVGRLGLLSDVIANALGRARAEEDLHQAYREIENLKHQLEKENENVYLREEIKLEHHHNEVIGDSEGIRRVLKKAEQVAATDSTVLLLGETGTGKELIARTIHEHSRRKNRVMVKVNCAALPASLVESELFGREKGAFTGALTREMGRFELANGSTILLDEIGELAIELQSKLLRVLQEGEFERLGSPKTIKVDVRVIAATSRKLEQAVREGKFREDLFYRLNVFPITIPPLRERREDIPPLVWHFVNDLSQRMGRTIESIDASTMQAFKSYQWPGNIRELRNVIERFLITNTGTVFRAEVPVAELDGTRAAPQTFEDVERNHFLHIMDLVGWRVRGERGAAEILGLKPTTLESRLQKLGIVRRK